MRLLCLPCHLYCMLASSCQGLVLGEALLGLLQAPLVCVHLPAASSLALQLWYWQLSPSLTAQWTPCSPEAGHSGS